MTREELEARVYEALTAAQARDTVAVVADLIEDVLADFRAEHFAPKPLEPYHGPWFDGAVDVDEGDPWYDDAPPGPAPDEVEAQ